MKKQSLLSRSRGFTLVELLTVIAIIGILAAILIPTVGTVMQKARITAAGSNARQIGQAYNIYALSGPRVKNISSTDTFPNGAANEAQWAGVLAIYGGLDDASFYFVSDDPAAPNTLPKTVLDPTTTNTLDSDFSGEAGNNSMAYTVLTDIPRNASATVTPILWTRGWDSTTNGWESDASPWGDAGGHIAYLDGHVTWQRTTAEDDAEGDLLDPSTGNATKDPEVAAGSGSSNPPTPYNESN